MSFFKVADKRCANCLYSKDKLVSDQRKAEIEKELKDQQQYFICHKATLNDANICCRGFYDKHGQKSQIVRIAQRLGVVEFVPLPETEPLTPHRLMFQQPEDGEPDER